MPDQPTGPEFGRTFGRCDPDPDWVRAHLGPQRRRLDHALEHLRHGVRWGLPDLADLERRWAAVTIAMGELRQAVKAKEASK